MQFLSTKIIVTVVVCSLILDVALQSNIAIAQDVSKEYYSDIVLDKVNRTRMGRAGDYKMVDIYATEYAPREYDSSGSVVTKIRVPGLEDPNAVPYLIDILQNGPAWNEQEVFSMKAEVARYFSRCYAILGLGAIGDHRATPAIINILHHGDYLKNKTKIVHNPHLARLHISVYAANALGYLEDPNAFEPLVKAMQDNEKRNIPGLTPACMRSLAAYEDVRAIEPILKIAHSANVTEVIDMAINDSLQYITKKRFKKSYIDGGYIVEDLPEFGSVPTFYNDRKLWCYWFEVADVRRLRQKSFATKTIIIYCKLRYLWQF